MGAHTKIQWQEMLWIYQWGTMASEHFDDEATIKWRFDSSNGDCVKKIVWKSSLINDSTVLHLRFYNDSTVLHLRFYH